MHVLIATKNKHFMVIGTLTVPKVGAGCLNQDMTTPPQADLSFQSMPVSMSPQLSPPPSPPPPLRPLPLSNSPVSVASPFTRHLLPSRFFSRNLSTPSLPFTTS